MGDGNLNIMNQPRARVRNAHVAAPLPARVIMRMLGLRGDDEAKFMRWTQSVADLLGGAEGNPDLLARMHAAAGSGFSGIPDEWCDVISHSPFLPTGAYVYV